MSRVLRNIREEGIVEVDYSAKRHHQRNAACDGVRLRTPSGIEFATYDDVSVGGMKLRLDHEIPLQTVVQVQFTARRAGAGNSGPELKVLARVVRCQRLENSYSVGIEFIDLNSDAQLALMQMVKSESGMGPF